MRLSAEISMYYILYYIIIYTNHVVIHVIKKDIKIFYQKIDVAFNYIEYLIYIFNTKNINFSIKYFNMHLFQ